MNYWLLKSEPATYSWEQLVSDGYGMWDGVRNYQARNNLRSMKKDDLLYIYHSGKNPGIVGIAEVTREYYPDPTAKDGEWSAIDIKPVRVLKKIILLKEIKQIPQLKDMILVKNSRLSVQPVTIDEYRIISTIEEMK